MILAGDIGGTKSDLALFGESDPRNPMVEQTFRSGNYPGLEALVREFVDQNIGDRVTNACLGVPGPVVGDRCETPNLPWIISTSGLRQALGIEAVVVINDLEATGYGIPLLNREELLTLNEEKAEILREVLQGDDRSDRFPARSSSAPPKAGFCGWWTGQQRTFCGATYNLSRVGCIQVKMRFIESWLRKPLNGAWPNRVHWPPPRMKI